METMEMNCNKGGRFNAGYSIFVLCCAVHIANGNIRIDTETFNWIVYIGAPRASYLFIQWNTYVHQQKGRHCRESCYWHTEFPIDRWMIRKSSKGQHRSIQFVMMTIENGTRIIGFIGHLCASCVPVTNWLRAVNGRGKISIIDLSWGHIMLVATSQKTICQFPWQHLNILQMMHTYFAILPCANDQQRKTWIRLNIITNLNFHFRKSYLNKISKYMVR